MIIQISSRYNSFIYLVQKKVVRENRPLRKADLRRRRRHGEILYYEFHHIIPVCLGGPDDTQNKLPLTPREHFLAHYILWKSFPDNLELASAFWAMALPKSHRKQKIQFKISSREYELLRHQVIKKLQKTIYSEEECTARSLRMSGSNNYWYGKKGKDHPGYGHKISKYGSEKLSSIQRQLGVERRKKSEKAFLYSFTSGILEEYSNLQDLLEKNNIDFHYSKLSNLVRRMRLNSNKFRQNKVTQMFKPMVNNTYMFIGDDIQYEDLQNYMKKFMECKKRGCTWYNNGIVHKLLNECPEGWIVGKLGTIRLLTYNEEIVYGNVKLLYQGLKKKHIIDQKMLTKDFKKIYDDSTIFIGLDGVRYMPKPKENILLKL